MIVLVMKVTVVGGENNIENCIHNKEFIIWFQSNGQRKASAPKAQLWFAMTPVFGALWAFLILGEHCTYHQISGAALLLTAIYISVPRSSSSSSTNNSMDDVSY